MNDLPPFLCCPEDRTPLRLADKELTARLNEAIERGQVVDRGGRPVTRPIDRGLIRAAGDVLYPIVDEIPVLLVEEAIPLGPISANNSDRNDGHA